MPNSIPFLALIAICAIAFSVLLLHKRAAWPVILLFSFSGMIYVFEFFIFVWKDSYRYSPHLLKIPYYDNVLGAIFSNLLSVPVAALYIAVCHLSWRWIVCLALAYGGVEWLFVHLGIYQHHWWRTWYTILALLLFFRLARQWPIWLAERSRAFQFVTLLMFTWSVAATYMYLLGVAGIRIYHIGYFQDPYHDDIFFSAMYGFFKAAVLSVTVTVTRHLWGRLGSLIIIFVADLILMQLGILRSIVPLWQYWLIYASCCLFVLWLAAVSNRKLAQYKRSPYIK